jgi:hypothetical protein
VEYFLGCCSGEYSAAEVEQLRAVVLGAYRWQYIVSGAKHPRFTELLSRLTTPEQGERIGRALVPLFASTRSFTG